MVNKNLNTQYLLILLGGILLFYPFIAIFVIAYLMIYNKVLNNYFIFLYTLVVFSLTFYLRLYGHITSINGSSDDAITYLHAFNILQMHGFMDFFKYAAMQGITTVEPFYWGLYDFIGYLTNYNKYIFVFLNYCLPIAMFLFSLRLFFKEKYLLAFLLISTFGYQYYYALIFSTWRQSLAFSYIILSFYFMSKNKTKQSFLLLLLATFTHLSSIIYLFIYLLYILKNSKLNMTMIVMITVFMGIVLYVMLDYYNDILTNKLDVYTSGKHVLNQVRSAFLVKFSGAVIISWIILKKSYELKDVQLQVFSFFLLIGNILVLATMHFGTITTRLQLSINLLFLITISYYISKYYDYGKRIYIFVLLIVFIIFLRLSVDDKFFSMFLLDGDFQSGIIYSIYDFWKLFNIKRGFE